MIEQLKPAITFGEGHFIGPVANDPTFFELSTRDQARLAGWASGCPVVEELTAPDTTDPRRGPENMLDRYSEVNFWFGQLCREAQTENPRLSTRLRTPVLRLHSEPVGKRELESIPESHYRLMSPLGTLPGYALPRIFLEQLEPAAADPEHMAQRMTDGLKIVRTAAAESLYPFDFLARVAEGLAQADADPMKVLKHIVGKGWMDEHNAASMLDRAKRSLEAYAPNLWQRYSTLTPKQKAKYTFV